MRYLVSGRLRTDKQAELHDRLANGTLTEGRQTDGDLLQGLGEARVDRKGVTHWLETCFCTPPLKLERSILDAYFTDLQAEEFMGSGALLGTPLLTYLGKSRSAARDEPGGQDGPDHRRAARRE